MSSRAAASRKRLAGEDKRPSSSKGFFSRSKSATVAPSPQIDPAPFVNATQVANHDATRPYNSPLNLNAEIPHARRNSVDTISPRKTSGPLSASRMGSAYPSPPHQEFQAIRITPNTLPGISSLSGQEQSVPYIEASYQPPPPIIATYQPPPPVHFTSQRPPQTISQELIEPLSGIDSLPAFPAPPNYPPPVPSSAHFHLPSPSTSPPQSSLLLQTSQPTSSRNDSPTPTYTSSHVPLPPEQYGPPPLQVSIQNLPQAHTDSPYHKASPAYPSPPPSSPIRLRLSPLRVSQTSLSSDSGSSSEYETRYGSRESARSQATSSLTPQRLTFPISPSSPGSVSSRVRPPESVSGSSDSSGRSVADIGTPNPTPKFIFPGSRSVAKPKVPKKISNSAINGSNLRARQESDASQNVPNSSAPPSLNAQTTSLQNSRPISDAASSSSGDSSSSSSGSNGSAAVPPSGYMFPVGRSRAQPSKIPATTKKRPGKLSGEAADSDHGERTRFIGILLKKKKKSKDPVDSLKGPNAISSSTGTGSKPNFQVSPTTGNALSNDEIPVVHPQLEQATRERVKHIKSRIGSYPLDPYNSVLLDNDRLTGELLARLNPTASPSFYNYGNAPPTSVLDLGCGQGHWVVDAAIAWKGYGTKVTGYDMVDISQGLLPWADEQGVKENIRFVRGNFLKQKLPFSDGSFDLVRMSCLALAIASDSWTTVLQEVYRVLMIGGRLELIDDLAFFPCGKAASALGSLSSGSSSSLGSVAPQLDITIPSATFTTFSIYDGETTNPGLGSSADSLLLYGVEEDVDDDTQTVNEYNLQSVSNPSPRTVRRPRESMRYTGISSESWNRSAATSRDLEALFEHMLLHKFNISMNPNEFILGMMKDIFGHAREVSTMHLMLAPLDTTDGASDRPRSRLSSVDPRRQSMGLSRSPGLVLWPSTLLPMSRSEIEIHASKHLRLLLSCKNLLVEHALEATDDEEIDEDSILEALTEYESFLRHRFNPPPLSSLSRNNSPYQDADAASIQDSIAESVSPDDREEMWQIQSDFQEHFGWQHPSSESEEDRPETPTTPRLRPVRKDSTPTISTFPGTMSSPIRDNSLTSPVSSLSSGSFEPSYTSPPFYSKDELTHVRTFQVYEAIKLDSALFGTAM